MAIDDRLRALPRPSHLTDRLFWKGGGRGSTIKALCRVLTSPLRPLPDFIIVGAMKAGTTALHVYFKQHPQIEEPSKKELNYFQRPHLKPLGVYRAAFPLAARKANHITGEATPEYLFHPRVASNIADLLPDVKIVAVLRDPVARAYSHWRFNKRRKIEHLDFQAAIDAEHERTQADYERLRTDRDHVGLDALHFSYKRRGYYAEQLRRYYEHFERNQILVIRSESLRHETQSVLDRCFRFLGIADHEVGDTRPQHVDPKRKEHKKQPWTEFDDLYQHFAPYNEDLYELLGVEPWWPERGT